MDQAHDNDQAITRDSLYGTAAESTYAGITSFMRRRYSRDLRGVDLVVSGVPFDTATTNRPGSRFGPPLALSARRGASIGAMSPISAARPRPSREGFSLILGSAI